jgi:hypothetical protein
VFFGFRFVARRAQPAISEEFLKSFGRWVGVTFIMAANSKALDHLLFALVLTRERLHQLAFGSDPFLSYAGS